MYNLQNPAYEGPLESAFTKITLDKKDPPKQKQNPLDIQVGGGHYKGRSIQPIEFIHANNLNFLEGCIVKRITRWRDKGGVDDLLKIKHEIDLLMQLEGLDASK